jgi:hypothetical protein
MTKRKRKQKRVDVTGWNWRGERIHYCFHSEPDYERIQREAVDDGLMLVRVKTNGGTSVWKAKLTDDMLIARLVRSFKKDGERLDLQQKITEKESQSKELRRILTSRRSGKTDALRSARRITG